MFYVMPRSIICVLAFFAWGLCWVHTTCAGGLSIDFDQWKPTSKTFVDQTESGSTSWASGGKGEFTFAGASPGGTLQPATIATVAGAGATGKANDHAIALTVKADSERCIWWYGGVGFWIGSLPSDDLSQVRLRINIKGQALPGDKESEPGDYTIKIISQDEQGGEHYLFAAGTANNQWQTVDLLLSEMTPGDPEQPRFDPANDKIKMQIEFFEAIGSWKSGGSLTIDNVSVVAAP